MSGSQFQQFNEDLNKMLGSTLTVSVVLKRFGNKDDVRMLHNPEHL